MSKRLHRQVEAVAVMDNAGLTAAWNELFDTAMPPLSPSLLVRAITSRMQEKALGSLPASSLRQLRKLATGEEVAPPTDLRPGTRLVRSWHGRTLCVTVMEDGSFELEGARYGSLTRIAREVTGAAWSGPRFFGLTPKRKS